MNVNPWNIVDYATGVKSLSLIFFDKHILSFE